MTKPEIFTIGVYGFDENAFFQTLLDTRIDTFCDLRARRGMRGSTYAFVNSTRLQQRLQELEIRYFHFKALAPGDAMRARQKEADASSDTTKRQRIALAPAFVDAYRGEVLADLDAELFVEQLGPATKRVAMFCVEREPDACHRSLVAQHLAEKLDLELEHLTP